MPDPLSGLNGDFPIALFPVRLETRFVPRLGSTGGSDLLIRVYPDDIHHDSHAPDLTHDEQSWGQYFWEQTWRAGQPPDGEAERRAAWAQLAGRFGARRAAWIAQMLTPSNPHDLPPARLPADVPLPVRPNCPERTSDKKSAFSRAAHTAILPDYWVAFLYQGDQIVVQQAGKAIKPDPLPTGLAPDATVPHTDDASLALDAGLRWAVDFGEAERIGMGLCIELSSDQATQGFDRLIVLGVKTSTASGPLSTADAAARLQTLLNAHHYTGGLWLVPPGTPTNTTEEVASGYSSQDPGYLSSYLVERGPDLTAAAGAVANEDASDGARAARALGIDPAIFAHVRNANGHSGRDASSMNDALWPATVGYFLRHIWVDPPSDDELDALRRHFVAYVRAAGPLPTLGIANQPYGMLPVTTLNPGHNRYADDGAPSLLAIFSAVHQYPQPNALVIANYARIGYNLTAGNSMPWDIPLAYEVVNRLPATIPNPGSYKVLGVHVVSLAETTSSDLIFCYSLADTQGQPTLFYSLGRNLDDLGLADSAERPAALAIGWAGAQSDVKLRCTALFDLDASGRPDLVLLSSSVFKAPAGSPPSGLRFYALAIAHNMDRNGQIPSGNWGNRTNIPLNILDPLAHQVSSMAIAYVSKTAQPDIIIVYTAANQLFYRIGKGLDAAGSVTRGWLGALQLPNPYPASVPLTDIKVSIAVTSTVSGQQNDLLVVWDAARAPDGPYWAVGTALDSDGKVTGTWSDFFSVPGWFGRFTPQAGPLREHVSAIAVLPRARTTPQDMLRSLWRTWRKGAVDPNAPHGVARVTGGGNLDQELRRSLRMTGLSRNATAFVLLGKLSDYYNAYRPRVFPSPGNVVLPEPSNGAAFLSEFYPYLLDRARSLDAGWIRTANQIAYVSNEGYPLRPAMAQARTGAGDRPVWPNYVRWIRSCGFRDIKNESYHTYDPDFWTPPETLLYLLLRHAMLLEYGRCAEGIRKQASLAVPPAEPELVDMEPTATPTIWRQLEEPVAGLTGTQTLGDYLDRPPDQSHPQAQALQQYRHSLRQLEDLPAATLERLMLETLDAGANRLDAWISSVATRRLDQIRQAHPTGVYLGGYGWVEQVRPSPRLETTRPVDNVANESSDPSGPLYIDPGNTGYVHAPSLPHAVTAAILRSGYLSHQQVDPTTGKVSSGNHDAFAIDLSSERVRSALWLLDGIRAGQSLGALLGYRFERGLHEHATELALDRYLPVFRRVAPPVISKSGEGEDQAAIGDAQRVLNGLELLRRYQKALSTPNPVWNLSTIPFGQALTGQTLALPAADRQNPVFVALQAELMALADVVDAASDACIAESVYQLVQGNHMRSGAVLNAMSRGTVAPPELQVLRTPRSGIALIHRILALFSGPAPATPAWTSARPRAGAEPLLNAWAARLLGDPQRVQCRAQFTQIDSGSAISAVPDETISLADLGLCPLDVVYAAAGSVGKPAFSEIEQRLHYEARRRYVRKQPAASDLPAAVEVTLRFERSDGGLSFPQLFEIARTVHDLFARTRPIDARDLGLPQQVAGAAIDVHELRNRANAAKNALDVAATALAQAMSGGNPAAVRQALLELSAFGLAATPQHAGDTAADGEALLAQAGPVAREAARRLERLATVEANVESLYTRFAQARNTLHSALQTPATAEPGTLRKAMLEVAALGVTGAVPKVDGSTPAERLMLLTQAADVRAELAARLATLDDSETQRGYQIERLQAVFGAEFRAVPRFSLELDELRADLAAAFAASAGQGAEPHTVLAWFQRVAKVRPGAGQLDTALLYAEATQSGASAGFSVAQLPVKRPGDTRPLSERWIALPFDKAQAPDKVPAPRGRLSLAVHAPCAAAPHAPPDLAQSLGGVLLEDWTEVLPSATETTAVTFHYDAPNASAPQAVLLAVTPEQSSAWDLPTLETIVRETLELSKMRLSEQAILELPGATAGLPPAFSATYFAVNGNFPATTTDGVMGGDTVSTDFLRLADQAVRFEEPLANAVVFGNVRLKMRAPHAHGVVVSARCLPDPSTPLLIGNAARHEDDPELWSVVWDTTTVPDQGDRNAAVATLTARLMDEQGRPLKASNTCRVDVNNHLAVSLHPVTSPGSGIIRLTARAEERYPVAFSAYYADDPGDASSVRWRNIGWGQPTAGGTWILDWDTRGIPDQGNAAWGTVTVCAALAYAFGDQASPRACFRLDIRNQA